MRKALIILLLFPHTIGAQSVQLFPVDDLNSERDEIACGIMGQRLLFCTNSGQDLVSDYAWNTRQSFHIESAERGDQWSAFSGATPLFDRIPLRDEGTACYDEVDSTLYFSSAQAYGKWNSSHLCIYSCRWNGSAWSEPTPLSICTGTHDYAHPYFDARNQLLAFSSDRPGGQGGMDIWFAYKIPGGWTEPANLGPQCNSAGNELFPTVFRNDIYYSSEGKGGQGGFDLFMAMKDEQYLMAIPLDSTINSAGDDVLIFFLNDETGFLTSNREGGAGGDDIYLFRTAKGPEDQHLYTALLECKGQPLQQAEVRVYNELKESVLEGNTGTSGRFSLEPLSLSTRYSLQVSGVDPSIYAETILYILDENGQRIQSYHLSAFGTVEFELLPFDPIEVDPIVNEDHSILTINLKGQVFNETPGDVGKGEPVMILDEKGETVAIAYTRERGQFAFAQLDPQLSYSFRLSEKSRADQVLVMDRGKQIVLPVLQQEAIYHRLNRNEAILLINDHNDTIYVAPEDVFVINRVYYDYNSARLTSTAQFQLDQLTRILQRNDGIRVDLTSYCDSRGSDEYNQQLSEKRAIAVMNYLAEHGVGRKRLSGQGRGEHDLLNACSEACSEDEHAINRRTEIRLLQNDK